MGQAKFSKQAMKNYLTNRLLNLEKRFNFNPCLGFSQLKDQPDEVHRAYGEWSCLQKIISAIDNGHIKQRNK